MQYTRAFLFNWGLKFVGSPQQTQRQNCLRKPWAGIWKTHEEQLPAEPIFVKHHVVWPVSAFLVESEARGTQPESQPPCCAKMWNRETGVQMEESFNWRSVNWGLGTGCQTYPCWHHHYYSKNARGALRRYKGKKLSCLQPWIISEHEGVKEKCAFLVEVLENATLTHLSL